MTVFGDKLRFAIEFSPIRNDKNPIPNCHFTYWVNGMEVGNLLFEAPICEISEEMRNILSNAGNRRNDDIFLLNNQDFAKIVFDCMTGENDYTIDNAAALDISYSMGHGYPLGIGNRFLVFVVENDCSAKVVVASEDVSEIITATETLPGEIDRVIRDAWKAIENP